MSSLMSRNSSQNFKKITSENCEKGYRQPANTRDRKCQSPAENPLDAVCNQLEKQPSISEHTFGDQALKCLLNQPSSRAPNYDIMQQGFDFSNCSPLEKSFVDPNLGSYANIPT